MAKPFYFVIQSWMLEELQLKLSEAAVYAYIDGLTTSEELGKQGWHGSMRRLAKVLRTSPSTMIDIVNRLEKRGLLHFYNGYITSTVHRNIDLQHTTVRNSNTFLEVEGDDTPF